MVRFWEILPGALAWITLLGLVFLSWQLPTVVVYFIILYDLFWLFKTIYFFFHLRFSFLKMRENTRINWLLKLKSSGMRWDHIKHLAVFTMYKEPYEVVRASILSLCETNFPLENIFLVLAIEERAGDVDKIMAEKLKEEFKDNFGNVLITTHPASLPGEVIGKAANEAWSVRWVYENVIKGSLILKEDVLVSVFDADTHPTEDYFGILTHTFLSTPDRLQAGYQPIIIFSNSYRVPFFARLMSFSCTFWNLIQQARPEQLMTFSCYSMPLKALVDVGFWHTNVIAEDARIFYQCLEHYSGQWRAVPLFYPVFTDAVSGNTSWETAKNLYKQQQRWAWGMENIPFVLTSFLKNKKFAFRKKIVWIFNLLENFHSWATSALIIFLGGFLPNMIGGIKFRSSVISYNLPDLTNGILNISLLGIVSSAFFSILLLSPKTHSENNRWYHSVFYFLQWAVVPIALIFFGSFPALDSATRLMLGGKFRLGYWITPKTVQSTVKKTHHA